MQERINEMKSIMRKLKDSKNESEYSTTKTRSAVLEALSVNEADEKVNTENDASESDLLLARLEDLVSRLEKAVSAADEEETPAEEEPEAEENKEEEAPEEEAAEEEPEEEAAEEAYQRSLEDRLSALERKFTESRRRNLCKRFVR